MALPDRPETSPRRAADLEPRPLAAHVVPNASRQRCRTRTYRCGTSASSKPTRSLQSRTGGDEASTPHRAINRFAGALPEAFHGRGRGLDQRLDERGGPERMVVGLKERRRTYHRRQPIL